MNGGFLKVVLNLRIESNIILFVKKVVTCQKVTLNTQISIIYLFIIQHL